MQLVNENIYGDDDKLFRDLPGSFQHLQKGELDHPKEW